MGGRRRGRIKKGAWGGTTNTNSFLKSHIETYYCRSFLKYIPYVKEMGSPYNMERQCQTIHPIPPDRPSSAILAISCWVIDQRSPVYNFLHKHHRLLPRLLITLHNLKLVMALLLKIPQCHQIWKNQAGVQLDTLPLVSSVHGARRHFACYQKKNTIIGITQTQMLWPTTATLLQDTLVKSMSHESNETFFFWI